MNAPDPFARVRTDVASGDVDDATFDALYADSVRAGADRFFTPLAVARRAAQLLALHGACRVLDVGSGAGKFCLTGACVHPGLEFVGIEQRPRLVEAARLVAENLRIGNVRFVVGDATQLSWAAFDGLYLYNPFGENICDKVETLDDTVELSMSRYMADVRRVAASLFGASVGTCIVTYHGYGGPIPTSYQLTHSERAHSDWLRVWVKHRPGGEGDRFYVEVDDDLLLVTDVAGKRRTERIPCAEAVGRAQVR
jgi:SAM-dependent methyltransferase